MAKRKKKKPEGPSIPRPTWSGQCLAMLETYQVANEEGKEHIRKEFTRMARAADAYNDLQK
jgi:hypothetical protein